MTNISILPTLLALGLTNEEANMYIFLVERGPSNVSLLARNTSMTRVTAYIHIENLLSKKFIQKTKQAKRILYQAYDPKTLLPRLEQLCNDGVRNLSLFAHEKDTSFFIPEIKVYSGQKEILEIYDDIGLSLPKGGTYFRYTSRITDQGRSPLYSKLRVEKELERLVITNERKSSAKGKDPNRFIKTVPKDFSFDDNVTVLIYGNKTAHIDFNSNTGIIIESKHLARFQEKLFKLLWKRL